MERFVFPLLELKTCKPGFAWILVSLLRTNNYSFQYNPFLVQQIKMGCNEVVLHHKKFQNFFEAYFIYMI